MFISEEISVWPCTISAHSSLSVGVKPAQNHWAALLKELLAGVAGKLLNIVGLGSFLCVCFLFLCSVFFGVFGFVLFFVFCLV